MGFYLADSSEEKTRQMGIVEAMYFLGRLDAERGTADLNDLVVEQISNMTSSDLKTEGARCSGIMRSRGDVLQPLLDRLQKMEKHGSGR